MSTRRLTSLVAVALLAGMPAACGGDEPERSAAAEQLAALCDEARADVEALGIPSEVGPGVLRPWAERGSLLAKQVERLRGATSAERQRLRELAQALGEYYAGLRLGHAVYTQTKSLEAYSAAVERATSFLEDAETIATSLGAPECTIRPFPDR